MDAVANRSSLYVEFGRQSEGLEWMEKAAEAFPNSPGLLFGQTELRRFERGDPLIAKMQTLLAREGISLSDRITLNFGLGKAFLDTGDLEAAFRHYDEGNRLKRSTYEDDLAEEAWMASIAEVFSRSLLEAKAGAGARSELPVFVVGMPRSGTTLTEQIVASHPMAHGAGELKRLHGLAHDWRFSGLGGQSERRADERVGRALFVSCRAACGRPRPTRRQDALELLLLRPHPHHPAGRADRPLPARPIDTCLSCYTKLFSGEQSFSYNQTELGRYHRACQALMAHWRSVLPATSVARWRKHAAQLGPLLEALDVSVHSY